MSKLTIAVSMPEQRYDRQVKMEWLAKAVYETECDLFLTPQEYFGGLYIMPDDMHIELEWLLERVGSLAHRTGKAIGVGACVRRGSSSLAFEEFLYFDKGGELAGFHRKLALPSYDDALKMGAGMLESEVSTARRLQPVELLGLRIGTVFCWEVFSLGLFPAYARQECTLIVHPIKFAPAAWPKLTPKDGSLRRIVGFAQDPRNGLWLDKLHMASRHEVLCPIAVTCNTWALGAEYDGLLGVVDETFLHEGTAVEYLSCRADRSEIMTFETDPALTAAFLRGDRAVLDARPDHYRLRNWTMHRKQRQRGF